MVRKELIQNIRKLRKSKGLTQKEISEELKINMQTYSGWERGIFNPAIDKIVALADYFGVNVNDLIGIDQWKDPTKELPTEWGRYLVIQKGNKIPSIEVYDNESSTFYCGKVSKWSYIPKL